MIYKVSGELSMKRQKKKKKRFTIKGFKLLAFHIWKLLGKTETFWHWLIEWWKEIISRTESAETDPKMWLSNMIN